MSVHQQLQTALLELEAAMKAANLWRTPTPDAAAFASQQPFCIDTMSLPHMVKRHLSATACKKFIKGVNWLHDILPHFKPALYLAVLPLSAANAD